MNIKEFLISEFPRISELIEQIDIFNIYIIFAVMTGIIIIARIKQIIMDI